MINNPQVPLFDLVACLSDAVDLVSPSLAEHHKQVAYIASALAEQMQLPDEQQTAVVLAGALHDIGALSLKERLDTLRFEIEAVEHHCRLGANLLELFSPLAPLTSIIESHHEFYVRKQADAPIECGIVHLADRIAVLLEPKTDILAQAKRIGERIREQSGRMFDPQIVEAFLVVSEKEQFWLDATSPALYRLLRRKARSKTVVMDLRQLNDLAMVFAKVIDFRSSFTATHSSGVAACAEFLASVFGFSERECRMMRIAGYLHDLGKLGVPEEILEKPGSLTAAEFNVVRRHTYDTFRILETVQDFEMISTWAAFHHERLNGKGYPFHHEARDLSLGSRIMCVADVFTAISEDRPYRKGMPESEIRRVLRDMADHQSLDKNIVNVLESHYSEICEARSKAQSDSLQSYRRIIAREAK